MTWIEMITIKTESSLVKGQVIKLFYDLDVYHPGKELADIALFCAHDTAGGFCIRLTWQGEIPEGGKSVLGSKVEQAFAKKGQACHAAWKREGNLVFY